MPKVVTRFAPSPTGLLHVGNYRTAVFAYLYAKQHRGEFVVRIENTDRDRSKKEYEDNILESLEWLGLPYDTFARQSEKLDRHTYYLEKLIAEDKAYISKEEAKDGSGVIKEIVRFRNPNKVVTFTDLIRGDISTDTTDLGDFVIAKNIHEPLFHLAVVVDDFEMGITHVIRGEDHIPNTPRQMLIAEAIGVPTPAYAHLPLVLALDRSKLSKRKGAEAITWYRDQGYLPEALLNFMALIGWNPGTPQEIFTREELVHTFDITQVQKSGAIANTEKLDWINREHLRTLSDEALKKEVRAFVPQDLTELPEFSWEIFDRLLPLIRERIVKFADVTDMSRAGEFTYFFVAPTYEASSLLYKKDTDSEFVKDKLNNIIKELSNLSGGGFTKEKIKEVVTATLADTERGAVLHPMRFALTGATKSPDPFTIAEILGPLETIKRLNVAITLLTT